MRARGFRRSLCLCVSGVPEGTSENEGSGRWMRSERKVVWCVPMVLLVMVAGWWWWWWWKRMNKQAGKPARRTRGES